MPCSRDVLDASQTVGQPDPLLLPLLKLERLNEPN